MSKFMIKLKFRKAVSSKIDFLLLLTIITGVFGYAYRKLFNIGVIFYPDLAPPILSWREAYDVLISPWLYLGLGKINDVTIETILLGMLSAPAIAQKFLFMLSIPMAAISMYFLLDCFVNSRFAKVVVSILYTLGPFVIDQFPTGVGVLPLYFFWPLLLLFLLKIFEEPNLRHTLIFSLLFALVSFRTLQTPMLLAPFIVTLFFIKIAEKTNLKYIIKVTVALLASIVLVVLLALPSFINFVSSFVMPQKGIYGLELEYLKRDLLTLYSTSYIKENFYTFLTITSIICVLVSFLKDGERRRIGLIFSSFMVVTITIWFLLTKMPEPILWLGSIFPIILGLRDYVKLILLFTPTYMVLLALLLDEVIEEVFTFHRSKKLSFLHVHWKSVYTVILVVLIGLFIFNLTYVLEPSKERNIVSFLNGSSGKVDVWQYEVPQVYSEIRDWVKGRKEVEGHFRVFLLPLDPYTSILARQYVPNALFLFPSKEVAWSVYMAMQGSKSMGRILAPLNIKYVVVNLLGSSMPFWSSEHRNIGPVRIAYHAGVAPDYYFIGDPNNFINILNEQDDLRLIAIEENFLVYENKEFTSHISVYNGMFLIAPQRYIVEKKSINLLANPDFEDGLVTWKKGGSPSIVEWITDTNNKKSGDYSLKLINHATTKSHWAELIQTIEVEPNTLYHATGWMKIKNVEESQFKIEFYDNNDSRLDAILIYNSTFGSLAYGTIDWWFFAQEFVTPSDAAKAIVYLMGGWSQDATNPGITWYDDINIVKGFYNPIPEFQMLLKYQKLLEKIPGFGDNRYLMIFDDLLLPSQRKHYQAISNALVFPGDIRNNTNISSILDSKTWIFMYDASDLVFESDALKSRNNGAMEIIGDGKALKTFFSPRNGSYEMAIHLSVNGSFSVTIDNKALTMQQIVEETNFTWYKSSSFYLTQGTHHINFTFNGESTIINQFFLLSSTNINKSTAEDIFDINKVLDVKVDRTWPAEYWLHIKSERPFLVVLSESFHSDWSAYINGAKIEHFPAFHYGWANAFYINKTGEMDIKITFRQDMWNLVIGIWATTWGSLLASIIILLAKPQIGKAILTIVEGHLKKFLRLLKRSGMSRTNSLISQEILRTQCENKKHR